MISRLPTGILVDVDLESVPALTTFTFLIGCFISSFIVSYRADYIGRKKSILFGGAGFPIGGFSQSTADNLVTYYMGRIISRLGIGLLYMLFHAGLCVRHCTFRSRIRGAMLTIQQLIITLGVLEDLNQYPTVLFSRSTSSYFALLRHGDR
jgi:MFS transporter, SP family, sugar:H+ symporter